MLLPQRLSRGFLGEVFVTVMKVQDFIVSECGQHPPMRATTGLLEWLQQPALALQVGADWEPRLDQQEDFGGSLGWWCIMPGPALQICGAWEMCRLFWGWG